VEIALDFGSRHLELDYGRYRQEYPYWHLNEVRGVSPSGRLTLRMRQRLQNPELDSAIFRLDLPPGTRPLID
jgi:hypothetical protein